MNRYNPSGFGYSNFTPGGPWAEFASDRDGDHLITERDFVISARERGWNQAGDECLAFNFILCTKTKTLIL